jgi:predicted O-linked N-acetylglucosamine transferase (SPINDLY family)
MARIKLDAAIAGLNPPDLAAAVERLKAAALRVPEIAGVHATIGGMLQRLNRAEEARQHFSTAVALAPDNLVIRLRSVMAELPVIYERASEIPERRRAYSEGLSEFERVAAAGTPDPGHVIEAVGSAQPFLLGYQGENDRELQRRYGAAVCALMARAVPEAGLSARRALPRPDEPIRVGVVSAMFCLHAVWKGCRGLITDLDPRRFRLFGYHTRAFRDHETAEIETRFDRFVQGPLSLRAWLDEIRRDQPHLLIYPEIGMDPMTAKLAALRLAPIQATWWGHSDTSGFPTIDYFLGSDLMEPADAAEHYTETLVRLPNLGTVWRPPEWEPVPLSRAELGMRSDAVVYWCCQALYKYLPQYDEIFPRIAERVPNAQLVFNAAPNDPYATQRFVERIARAFAARGLDAGRHALMLPRLGAQRFLAACGLCDVFLDSVGWSGFNTTLESLTHHLPVVTWPTGLMRGRQNYAVLQMLGITDTVADSLDRYVEIAVRLGLDRSWREDIRNRTAAAWPHLLADRSPARALEAWLEEAVRSLPAGSQARSDL